MASLFNTVVRLGSDGIVSETLRDEIKLINSISFHSIFLALFAGILGMILMPTHAILIGILTFTEVIAKTCVLLLNSMRQFFGAKLLFSFITLFIFLSVC
jgi:hypothetical protein